MNESGANLLQKTAMLDYDDSAIQSLIKERGWTSLEDEEKASRIYDFVKDEILFGYNVGDDVKASRVLSDGYGQCNTKGTLFMALLRAVGIPCRIHGFTIDKILQKGAMTGIVYKAAPKEIFHSFVEAYVGGRWFELEGFILDDKYLSSLQKTFSPSTDGSFVGYGVATKDFLNPPVYFCGCNTYIQKEGIVKDFGVYDDPDTLLLHHGQEMGAVKSFVYKVFGRKLMNRNVRRVRNGK